MVFGQGYYALFFGIFLRKTHPRTGTGNCRLKRIQLQISQKLLFVVFPLQTLSIIFKLSYHLK